MFLSNNFFKFRRLFVFALLGMLGTMLASCDEASQEDQGNVYYERDPIPTAEDLFCSSPSEEDKVAVEHSFSPVDISTGHLFLSAVQLAEKAKLTGLESASIDLRDSSNELFELRNNNALHIKDQQSFLTNIQENRREALLVLKDSQGEYCLLLSLQPESSSSSPDGDSSTSDGSPSSPDGDSSTSDGSPSSPDGDSSTSDGSPSSPDGDSQVTLLAEQPEFQLPYVWWNRDSGKARTVFAGNIPHINYIGKVLTLTTDTPLNFELVSVSPAAWANFFGINEETGALYISDQFADLSNVFNVEKDKSSYGLSQLDAEYQKEGLPLPEQFVLTVNVSLQDDSNSEETTHITVKMPKFGNPDCSILDWDADLEGWTEEQVSTFQRGICKHLDYKVRPRGKEFITDQAILNTLPGGLTQPKANYQVIFRDEFNEEGGIEKLDHRLWTARYSLACNQFRQEGGVIHLRVADDCRSADAKGNLHRRYPSITTAGKFEYKYGYIEARFNRVPITGRGVSFFSSWGSRPALFSKSYRDFMCRGNNPQAKRMRWLTSRGVEMQHLEFSKGPSAWWLHHLIDPKRARNKCHTYSDGRGKGIHSGLWWATHSFVVSQEIVIGVEWTPAGYKGFINGEPYKGWASIDPNIRKFYEYGYSTPTNTGILGYKFTDIPNYNDEDPDNPPCSQLGDCIIDRTVSHAYQDIGITMSANPAIGVSSQNWEDFAEIDYIRVFQPEDQYSDVEKTYK